MLNVYSTVQYIVRTSLDLVTGAASSPTYPVTWPPPAVTVRSAGARRTDVSGVYLSNSILSPFTDKSYFNMSSKRPHSPKLIFFSLQYEFIKRGFQETEHVVGEHAKPCFSKTFHIALVQTVEPAVTILLTVSTLLIMWEHT